MKAERTVAAWRIASWLLAGFGCIVYALLTHRAAAAASPGLAEAGVILAPLLVLGLVLAWRSERPAAWVALWLASLAALYLARHRVAAGTQWLLLLQHVGFNAALCLGFGRTLARDSKPLVSRLAEIVHGPLSPRLTRYTRSVTWAWVAYFGSTAVASLSLFALAPAAAWSAFVNLLSLPLLAAMFTGEYLVRILVVPRAERGGFFESVAAYRQFARGEAAKRH